MSDRREQQRKLAEALLEAYQTREPIKPLRDQLPGMDLDDAYAIQLIQEQELTKGGRSIIGRKIGLTSLAMQTMMGVDSPDFGFMLDDPRFIGRDDAHFDSELFLQPRIEPELAFVLKSDLSGPGVSLEQAVEAIDTVHMAIEIIDSRIASWDIKLVDTVADNASYGAIAWSKQPIDLAADKLTEVECVLEVNGQQAGTGRGTDVMGHPAAPLQWLANTLGERGVGLSAGEVVLPGSFCAAVDVAAGTTAVATYGSLGSLTIHFD